MDRSTLRLPDPGAGSPNRERRRAIRQKLHTPVYASFNGPDSGMVVDLSELLDLHEEGFAVQTSERLEIDRAITLCLDLPETRSFVHGSGEVIWSDHAGRSGIRFSSLPDAARQALKEWLFANLLIASSNHVARSEQLARRKHEEEKPAEPVSVTPALNIVLMPDRSGTLPWLDATRRQVRDLGDDVEAILQFITESAWELTGASGTALALITDDKMVWRTATGHPAPPRGSLLDVGQGLSGECVRTGIPVSCENMENDPRIDPEIGRALGIGSLMAAPIVSDFRVVGLLELFSPHPQAFTTAHGVVLDRLVEMVPRTPCETIRRDDAHPELSTTPHWEERVEPKIEAKLESRAEPALERKSESKSESKSEAVTTAEAMASVSQPPASKPLASQSTPFVEAKIEPGSIQAIRAALWDQESEVPEPALQRRTRPTAADRVLEPVVKTASSLPSRLLHLGLLGMAIIVVAMVIGYLVGPMIEKHWPGSAQASQKSLIKGTGAATPVSFENRSDRASSDHAASDHGAADRGSIEQHQPLRSLPDLQTLANQGDPEAQWQLGLRYHNGEGVLQSDTQAMLWFQLAAEQGHVTAQAALGAYYWAGRGVPQDLSKSYFWSEIALAQGDENSKSRLEGLSSQMTQSQVSAARQKAEVWIRNHSQRVKSEAN